MATITKIIRLKIVKPIIPTDSWKEFRKILSQLHEETRQASNHCITHCNFEYSRMVENRENKPRREIKTELYAIAKSNAPSLYSYNSNSISNDISNLYFGSSKGSYVNKMKRGDGNPPMSYSKSIPIPIASKNDFKFEILSNGYYNFSFPLISTGFKNEWNKHYTERENCYELKSCSFTVGIDATKSAIKAIIDRCISGEYKMGGSKIVNKDGKYYIHLTYSFESKDMSNDLIEDRVMGVDLGVNVPAYLAVNYNSDYRRKIGGRCIIDKKIEIERKLKEAVITSTTSGRDGHGRKSKVEYPSKIRRKESNYTKTCNERIANQIIKEAIKCKCKTIHLEKLTGFYSIFQKNKFLENWTYYNLQELIERDASKVGIDVKYVDPKYTSQTCSRCGNIDKDNRPKGDKGAEYFCCTKCGFKTHADYNAALNISRKEEIKSK